MSLTDKYKSVLSRIVEIEETSRQRCGYMYEITLNLDGKNKTFFFDMNHRFYINGGKIRFEKNKDPRNGKDWDYKSSPIEMVIIGIISPYNQVPEIEKMRNMFNEAYKEYERRWKANCKKEECDGCLFCEQ